MSNTNSKKITSPVYSRKGVVLICFLLLSYSCTLKNSKAEESLQLPNMIIFIADDVSWDVVKMQPTTQWHL